MGIFGGGYMKEGPGVSKDAAKKKGFFLYWDIVFRKFKKLTGLNTMYMLTSILFLAIAYVFLSSFVINGLGISKTIESVSSALAGADYSAEDISQTLYFTMRAMITVLLFNYFGAGPVSAAYAYVSRCYTLGQHAWLFSDGWDKIKENFLYSMLIVIIDILVIFLGMNAIAFYTVMAKNAVGFQAWAFQFITAFVFVLLVVYAMTHTYMYQIMVTYECKFGELWKSSVIMTLAKLPMNVLLTAITAVVLIAMFYLLPNPLLAVIIYWFVGITFLKYPLDFYATRVIEKNIKAVKKKEKKREAKITYLDE